MRTPTARRRLAIAVALILIAVIVVIAAVQQAGLIRFPGDPTAAARLATVDPGGALVTMDDRGGSVVRHAVPGVAFAFPAWSPDGSRIATIGQAADGGGIHVFSARTEGAGETDPSVIYRSPDRPPFYLYWQPDGRAVTFLTTEPDAIALRIAPADGSQADAIIRQGAPLYWDFASPERLFVHIGADGPDAFLGELGLDGASVEPAVIAPGAFRAPAVSLDGRYRAWVGPGDGRAGTIVVESRDGSGRHAIPVFGGAALTFDPTGAALAFIAPADAAAPPLDLPLGPLRVVDAASGTVRTLADGNQIAFFWAPDGRTIASLRFDAPGGGGIASSEGALAAAGGQEPAVGQEPGLELRLLFVDAASGAIRSERTVRLSTLFVQQVLPFFDQYALSHRLWSPDSASVVLPLVGEAGRDQLVVIPADGSAARTIADGAIGFWSP